MAQQLLPITFAERANLVTLGVNPESIRFGNLTMESEKYICVREQNGGTNSLTTVDMSMGNAVVRRPLNAEMAIMNPETPVIALKGGQILQMFNTEAKVKIKSYKLPEGQTIVYWRWVDSKTVAFVTASAVFHWSMEGADEPKKMFERHATMMSGQIINYQSSVNGQWLLLVGISQGAGGAIEGNVQLHSLEKNVSQPLPAHAGCFTEITLPGETQKRTIFSFVEKKAGAVPKLHVMEAVKDKSSSPNGVFKIQPREIPFPADAAADFPVSLLASKKHDILYLITKFGYLYLFDIHTGSTIYRNRISADTIFVTARCDNDSGVIGVTAKKGQVLQVNINEQALVPYIKSLGNMNQLAISLASRLNLPGAEDMYLTEFERLFSSGDVKGAAKLAAESPQNVLRNMETIQRFQQLPQQPNEPSPVLQYFQTLLGRGKLNAIESVELARPVLQQGRQQMLEQWLKEDKLECSEALGDMVAQYDANMALSVYLRANVPEKVVNCFLHTGDYAKAVAYSVKVGYQPDYMVMLQNLVRQNPKGAEDFAKMLINQEGPPLVDVNSVVDVFMQLNRIEETTSFLLEALKENKKEEGHMQTRLLEINLLGGAPQMADAIFQSEMFSHYDKLKIARLCESSGLFQRALEHYSDIEDIRRVIVNTHAINPEFLVTFFGTLSPEVRLECLDVMLQHNLRGNLQTAVQIAIKYSAELTPAAVIELLEKYNSYDGLYIYTGAVLNFTEDPEVHFKYIQSACKMGQLDMVIKVCRESNAYEPERVKEFLLLEKLGDPRPLIHVCDRHGYVDELTSYLYTNKLLKHIQVYVEKVAPAKTPQVIGRLLDLDCEEDFIRQLLDSVRNLCPVDPLVEEVEQRNRLRMLQPWLEQRVAEGNTEAATHNAIGKIYVTINKDPQQFLLNNQFYDSKVVGKFCEKLDPYLAFLAYKRAWGQCDDELIEVTNKNELFKDQARYCVERQDKDLWARVLSEENPHRRRVIDETVQTAFPESKTPEEVSATVKAFLAAEIPMELIELLEKIVLHGSEFSDNRNLQNLLILTAIKADKTRVMDYIHRLDGFDGPDIAKIACSDAYMLHEEGFEIFKKFNLNVDAIDVLLHHIESLERGMEFAVRCNEPEVWSHLAKAQLDANMVTEAIDSFIKANDPAMFADVISASEREEQFDDLVRYLEMARKKVKDRIIDTELIFALAKTKRQAELEEFVASPNVADIQGIGDRLFDEGMFESAKILFNSISNNAKLASCFVQLGQFREAVEAARKANSFKTWKEVNAACVATGEFRLAAICGLHIIVSPDHLEDLVGYYEKRGHWEELISLMEQGLGLEGAHAGIFTELGILYSKYKPEKLMEHIKIFSARMNIPKMLRACEKGRHWEEGCFLHIENEEFDAAVRLMMDHPESAWEHNKFMDCVLKVRNQELFYKGLSFYLEFAPMRLEKLLQVLTPKLDHGRVVQQIRRTDNLPLIMPYLKSVQSENISAVNEAMNEVLVEDEDYEALRISIDEHDNFDQIALAQTLEKHELLEMRRISSYLYKKNKRYAQSVQLSKADEMYKDAIDTAADSGEQDIAEELAKFFVNIEDKECFCATLYTCYELIRPDVVLEMAWRYQLTDFAMPFIIQYMRETHTRLKTLEEKTAEKVQEAAEEPNASQSQFMSDALGNPMMLTNSAYNPNQFGGNMGGMQPQMGGMQMGGMQPQMGGMQMGGMQQPQMGGMQQQMGMHPQMGGMQQGYGM